MAACRLISKFLIAEEILAAIGRAIGIGRL